jgi:methylated-DNA-protein-cysteine methyltransferase-like protein
MKATIKISEKNKDFFDMVFEVVKQIPPGRVTSYGAIGKYLGMARSARMVGWAMNASHACSDYIPAHRVVNRAGMLTGKHHFGGEKEMQRRLEAEGIEVTDDRVVDFVRLFWDPSEELTIE